MGNNEVKQIKNQPRFTKQIVLVQQVYLTFQSIGDFTSHFHFPWVHTVQEEFVCSSIRFTQNNRFFQGNLNNIFYNENICLMIVYEGQTGKIYRIAFVACAPYLKLPVKNLISYVVVHWQWNQLYVIFVTMIDEVSPGLKCRENLLKYNQNREWQLHK